MDLANGITQEDLKLFLQEADEQLELLDEDIVRLEKEASNPDLMQEIFRAAHTLKGSSAMVGHQRMSDMAHAMENVLDALRKNALAVSPPVVDALLHGLDTMRLLRGELVNPGAKETDISEAAGELTGAMGAGKGAAAESAGPADMLLDIAAKEKAAAALKAGNKVYRVRVTLDKNSSWASVRCFQMLFELAKAGGIIASVPTQQEIEEGNAGFVLQALIAGGNEAVFKDALKEISDVESVSVTEYKTEEKPAVPTAQAAGNTVASTALKDESRMNQTVRVDVSRLDTLMEQMGELVIYRNQIGQLGRVLSDKYRDDEVIQNLGNSIIQIGKIVSTLQEYVMSIRLLPIEIVFNTLPRMVRDTARRVNKKIDFIMEGQETEVDRSVIEHLRDPLIHLLRNAVDHGIERPEARAAAGKPETGTVRLSAYHQEDNIIIKLTDDGRGINRDKLRQAAVAKNLMSAEAAANLTDQEAIELIFRPGFSTAEKVTDISGRGVGLDVVKTNIELLSGTVHVDSVDGKGLSFILTLPLTLAIIPALLVSTSQTVCAVPLSCIVESNKLELQNIKTVRGREVTMFRGNVLPLLRLDEIFGWNTGERKSSAYVVVVKYAGTQVGLIVDALLEQQELVVKSLDHFVSGSNGITGASILGDGCVVLILDIASLVREAVTERRESKSEALPLQR